MRICAFVPIFKREKLAEEMFRRLKEQTCPLEHIVAIGSCDEDRDIAMKCGVDYIEHENQPLSNKVQASVEYLRQFEPDAIMGVGSDDFPTSNWVEELSTHLENYDIVGTDHLYFCLSGSRPPDVIRYHYAQPRYGEPMGVGRLISRRVLDRLNWKLYPLTLKSGLDGASHRRLMAYGAKPFLYKDDKAKILCPKGMQDQLTGWSHGLKKDHHKRIDNGTEWIETNFPGLMEKRLI